MQAETRAGEAPRPLEIVVISLAGAEARRRLRTVADDWAYVMKARRSIG